jgi:lipid II:glycine glycyltransferase (peptidoglycan interpeptide bridge formation enzyme)
MQSVDWGKQKPQWRWYALMAQDEAGTIRGSMALLIRKAPLLPCALAYGARGPIFDSQDPETLEALLSAARGLALKHRCFEIKLDPAIHVSDTHISAQLLSAGYRHTGGGKNFEGVQPRFVFRLDIQGKTPEEVFAGFHQKWRYNIRLAERKGVAVEIRSDGQALDDFAALMAATGKRDGFGVRDRAYFAAMLQNLGKGVRLYMAYSNGQAIAGSIAVAYGDKVWYLYGASGNESRDLMPNYLLQWHMIQWALERRARLYDFRGVSGDLSEDNPLYGLYRFKKGFGGELTEFIGEYDLVLSPFWKKTAKFGERVLRFIR